jgi:beta-lactamase class A
VVASVHAGSLESLRRRLEHIAAGIRADWGVYVKFLTTHEEIALNADAVMDTMSVIKIPLLLELLRQTEEGGVDLDRRIVLETAHKRFGTGVLADLDDGLTLTLRDAATLMITQSDNTATDLCFDAVGGPEAPNRLMRELGLDSIEALGTAFDWFSALAGSIDAALGELSPGELFTAGYPAMSAAEREAARTAFHLGGGRQFGRATAADVGRLLELIHDGSAASPAVSAEALRIMRLQQHRSRIPRYLLGASCAHKTGDFDPFVANDVGLIGLDEGAPVVVVFLTARHRGVWENLEDGVARMAEGVWERALTLGDASGE